MKLLLLLFSSSIVLTSCRKPHQYKACFSTTKDTFSVGEKVTFANCSQFDGGITNCLWDFGEGPPSRKSSIGHDDITFNFTYPGNKTISLLIGEKENQSDTLKVIFIK